MLGQPMALPAQLLQFLSPSASRSNSSASRVASSAGAQMGLQHARTQALAPQRFVDGLHRRAVERDIAQDQRVGAGLARRPQQSRRGIMRRVAIEQRRAKRAVGMGAHQSGQRNPAGVPHRHDRHQADQPRRASGAASLQRDQRGCAGAAARGRVHRQFPVGQIIAVRLDRAFGQRAPLAGGDGRQRGERRHLATAAHAREPRLFIEARPTAARINNLDHPFPRSRGTAAHSAALSTALSGKF